MLESITSLRKAEIQELVPNGSNEALDLLQQCLQFDPVRDRPRQGP
jgi:hypothetical protein